MIVSASRRTDIPRFYGQWFANRLKAGYAMTRNPMNRAQTRRVSLSTEDVDLFVFWTKDPDKFLNILPGLEKSGYFCYFQFTLTPYGREIERNQRDKAEIARTFAELSARIGKERVLWRYDPIIINAEYGLTAEYHFNAFARLCGELSNYTESVTISFADAYAKLKNGLVREISPDGQMNIAGKFAELANEHGLIIQACCEGADLAQCGVKRAACVDRALAERLTGRVLPKLKPDRNQRENCGCVSSVDIGAYNTCPGGCAYCYANYGEASVGRNAARHDPEGEFLI